MVFYNVSLPRILCILFVIMGLVANSSTNALESRYLEIYDLEGRRPPERMTTNITSALAVYTIVSYDVRGMPFPGRQEVVRLIAHGDYDEAIDMAKREMNANFPPYEEEKDAVIFAGMQRLLADAYELKGDWNHALHAYVSIYGDRSIDYKWVRARVLYASGNKDLAFRELRRICMEQVSTHDIEVASFLHARADSGDDSWETSLEKGYSNDWRFLWCFRDNCVRLVLPEIYYVTSFERSEGVASFPEIQREAFERFLAEVKENSSTRCYNFFVDLHCLPYDIAPDGRNFHDKDRPLMNNGMGGM